jgi:hypothetical protein
MAKGWKRVWILGLMAWNAVAGTGAMAVDNPLGFVAALARNGVPVEAHVFEKGGHGPRRFRRILRGKVRLKIGCGGAMSFLRRPIHPHDRI